MKYGRLLVSLGIAAVCTTAQSQVLQNKAFGARRDIRELRQEARQFASRLNTDIRKGNVELKIGGAYTAGENDLSEEFSTPVSLDFEPAGSPLSFGLSTDGYAKQRADNGDVKQGWRDPSFKISYKPVPWAGIKLKATMPIDSEVGSDHWGETLSFASKGKIGGWSIIPLVALKRKTGSSSDEVKNFRYASFDFIYDLKDQSSVTLTADRASARGETTISTIGFGYEFPFRSTADGNGWFGNVTVTHELDGRYRDNTMKLAGTTAEFDLIWRF
jgi:hypothetical protein